MEKVRTKKEYLDNFRIAIDTVGGERKLLNQYLEKQFLKMEKLTAVISKSNFWQVFPEILGVDAKLTLMSELIQFADLSNEEVIRIVEDDYTGYFSELCGYDKNSNTNPSIVFNIL